jgi:hypothetical protein
MTTKAQQYVTKASVARANARLVGRSAVTGAVVQRDTYEQHRVARPSRQDIAQAGARALRTVTAG